MLVYWVLLFSNESTPPLNWYLRVDRHGISFLLVVVDHVLSRTPIRLLHFIYPSLMMTLYGVISGTYSSVTKRNVYSKMNFVEQPLVASGLVALCVFVASPLGHFVIYWSVYRLREKIFASK